MNGQNYKAQHSNPAPIGVGLALGILASGAIWILIAREVSRLFAPR